MERKACPPFLVGVSYYLQSFVINTPLQKTQEVFGTGIKFSIGHREVYSEQLKKLSLATHLSLQLCSQNFPISSLQKNNHRETKGI